MAAWSTDRLEQFSFLTPEEVSNLLRVSVYTIRRWIKEGDLPAYKIGRVWRIEQIDLDEWLRQHRDAAGE